MKRPAP